MLDSAGMVRPGQPHLLDTGRNAIKPYKTRRLCPHLVVELQGSDAAQLDAVLARHADRCPHLRSVHGPQSCASIKGDGMHLLAVQEAY